MMSKEQQDHCGISMIIGAIAGIVAGLLTQAKMLTLLTAQDVPMHVERLMVLGVGLVTFTTAASIVGISVYSLLRLNAHIRRS